MVYHVLTKVDWSCWFYVSKRFVEVLDRVSSLLDFKVLSLDDSFVVDALFFRPFLRHEIPVMWLQLVSCEWKCFSLLCLEVHFLFKSHFVVLDQLVFMASMIDIAVGVIIRSDVFGISSSLFKRVHCLSILSIHLSSSRSEIFWERKISSLIFSFISIHFSIEILLVVRTRLTLSDLHSTSKTSAVSLIVHHWDAVLLHVLVDGKDILHFFFSKAVSMVIRYLLCASRSPVLIITAHIEVLLFKFSLQLVWCSLMALVLLQRSVHFPSILLLRLHDRRIPFLLSRFFLDYGSFCSLIKSEYISLAYSHGLPMLRLALQEATLLLETVIISRIRSKVIIHLRFVLSYNCNVL